MTEESNTTNVVIAPVVPCAHHGNDCSSGYKGDRCEGCLRNGTRADLTRVVPALIERFEEMESDLTSPSE